MTSLVAWSVCVFRRSGVLLIAAIFTTFVIATSWLSAVVWLVKSIIEVANVV